MNFTFILLFMIFMHLIADYNLQGCLADLKQKSFWLSHPDYNPLYANDYKISLFCHSFGWTFCIMLPIMIACGFSLGLSFVIAFAFNIIIHYIVDDLKANQKCINLVQDQLIHIMQILGTFWLFTIGVL